MPGTETDQYLAQAFARLSQAAARRKVYSRQAARDKQPATAYFLRAMAASETVQARRLLNNLIGKIDRSDKYLMSIFEKEVQNILENYTQLIDRAAQERPALLTALTQIRAAETRLRSFYSAASQELQVVEDVEYFVCPFCGYLGEDRAPGKCPICGASKDAFTAIL